MDRIEAGHVPVRARIRRRRRRLALASVVLLGCTVLAACQLPGPTIAVTSTIDAPDAAPGDGVCEAVPGNGDCTLRAAVMEANADPGLDNITIGDGSTYVLAVPGTDEDGAATGDLDLSESVTITGRSSIDAAGIDRVLDVRAGSLILDGPSITGGELSVLGAEGGGIRVAFGAGLATFGTTVHHNRAVGGGAGIEAFGPVTLHRSTVSDNVATVSPPWISNDGAGIAMHSATLTITEGTVSGNTAESRGSGGGIFADNRSLVVIERSTISGNEAQIGSGIRAWKLTMRFVTVADNRGSVGVDAQKVAIVGSTITSEFHRALDAFDGTVQASIITSPSTQACVSPVTSFGYNRVTDDSCLFEIATDQAGVETPLAPLADNGGPTLTRRPAVGSPAMDAIPIGSGSCDDRFPTDQRGAPRPQGTGCDIGAVEGP